MLLWLSLFFVLCKIRVALGWLLDERRGGGKGYQREVVAGFDECRFAWLLFCQ